jgi:hypothetical protein
LAPAQRLADRRCSWMPFCWRGACVARLRNYVWRWESKVGVLSEEEIVGNQKQSGETSHAFERLVIGDA